MHEEEEEEVFFNIRCHLKSTIKGVTCCPLLLRLPCAEPCPGARRHGLRGVADRGRRLPAVARGDAARGLHAAGGAQLAAPPAGSIRGG